MTWLSKPIFARILKGVAVAWLLALFPALTPLAQANNWGEMAMVSATMGISDSRICIGEGSRGDLGCPSYAPTISPTGRINASAGLTVDSVSLTTTGTTWGYLGSLATYLPNLSSNRVSVTTISTTVVQIASTTTVTTCNSGSMGSLRYNSASASLELCNGTSWQTVGSGGGVGVPTGAIAAFASTTCPTGWSEYTAARGRFLRGIDNGAGNDPSGTRVPGGIQQDALQNITGSFDIRTTTSGDQIADNGTGAFAVGAATATQNNLSQGSSSVTKRLVTFTASSVARTATETRPKNVAVIFCEYTGSGGSSGGGTSSTVVATTPAGLTGQIQYNTSGSFDASSGLTWDNATSRLTTVNISATALTVNGVAITGSSSGDRITSGTTTAVATPAGTIDVSASLRVTGSIQVTGTIQLMSATTAPVCTAATAGTIARINGKTYECRM
ncbi:complement C1q protein [Rhizobium sp. TH135]|uniref:complement C1q protein n=1 Tax=Rhizobium sp. TH135 TaxID=2067451 RepID=UPI000C7B1F26|nr:complement C1q protein [Rhizobium sp. TH135]PLK68690.1 complement C1q protein [Rhizobium sp. TH135]